MNRLLFCEPWPVSNFALISRSIPCRNHFTFCHASNFSVPKSLLIALGLLGRSLLCRGLRGGLLGNSLFGGCLFLGRLRCLVVALGWRGSHLFLLRTRAARRFGVIGQHLGDAKHRDLVAI